jgi:hypothetical protein
MILMRKQLGQEAIGGCLPSLFFVRWKMKKGLRDGLKSFYAKKGID